MLSVPVNVQAIFNALAGSDLPAHLAFLQSAKQYHDSLREFYYPFQFKQVAFTHADYAREPKHSFTSYPDLKTVYRGLFVNYW